MSTKKSKNITQKIRELLTPEDLKVFEEAVDGMIEQNFPSPAGEPAGLTFDGKYLWVTDRITDRIYLVNPSDGLCLSSFRSHGPFPYGLAWGED